MLNDNLVGIVSDTHDNRTLIRNAVDVFNNAGCSLVVHAGDFIAPFTSREFEKIKGKFLGVFGNNDGEKKGLMTQFSRFGSIYEAPHEFTWYGKRFVVMHDPKFIDNYITNDDIDVIIYGHLHEIDIRPGKPMVINPGECCLWLSSRSVVVVLDLDNMKPELVDVGS